MRDDASNVRVVVRPLATPLPLGCFAFGIGNVLLAAYTAHWFARSDAPTLAVMMLAFVAPLELAASVVAFLARDTGAATAMGLFAGGWVVQGLELLVRGPETPSPAIGSFLVSLALCLVLLAVCASGKPLVRALFCVAAVRSLCAGLVQFGVTGPLTFATAIAGLAIAVLAFYCGLGFLLEDARHEAMPMTLRSGKAADALRASLSEQVADVSREAGVRGQL